MSTCPQCGTTYPSHVSICSLDGAVLASDGAPRDPLVGTVIAGKYRIDAVIGRGGMGTVYRATHVMLNKTVAVKTIKPEVFDATETVQRFQREARAATSLEHPNIVAVYDLGQADDGSLYIAMEFVDGINLKDVIGASGPMPVDRIVRLLTQVASALARAHRNHIVHRDLKPQNLVITTDADGDERVKLLDFGIAKTFEEGATQLTAAGYSLGTPHYMAPEQAVGQQVDGRADIYALGVILYEMLVGDVPFDATSAPAVLVKHLNDAPEPPSHRRPDLRIPPALEVVALRCLEKDRTKRFQTADEFSTALQRSVPSARLVDADAAPDDVTLLPLADGHIAAAEFLSAPAIGPPATPDAVASAAPAIAPPPLPQVSMVPVPPPVAALEPGTRPTIQAPGVTVAPPPIPRMAGGGKGRLIAVLLGVSALFLIALVLGAVAAYRAWTSRSQMIAAESISTDPAPASVPAAAPDTQTAPDSPAPADRHDAPEAAAPEVPPPSGATVVGAQSGRPNAPSRDVSAASPAGTRAATRTNGGEAPDPPATGSGAADTNAAQTPQERTAPSLPKVPPVYFECTGEPDVCGALGAAFERALEREGLPHVARPDRAEVVVSARATLLETTQNEQFGTSFAVQTFSLDLQGESTRDGVPIGMPAAKTFSFDRRFGQERAAEQGRLMADDAIERVQKFWAKRIGG
jgi:eukaryotic-like serine/threonine-protein kinase